MRQSRQAQAQTDELSVREVQLRLAELGPEVVAAPAAVKVACAGKPVEHSSTFDVGMLCVSFRKPVLVKPGQALTVRVSASWSR